MATAETKKSGARFNVFDVLIILAILACIAAIAVRAYFTANAKDNFTQVRIEFAVLDVSENTAASFHAAHKLYLTETNDEIGVIDEASYAPSVLYAENDAGELVTVNHPRKKDVHGTATVYGIATDDAFMIGGTIAATVGKTVSIYTDEVTATITIISVTPVG